MPRASPSPTWDMAEVVVRLSCSSEVHSTDVTDDGHESGGDRSVLAGQGRALL